MNTIDGIMLFVMLIGYIMVWIPGIDFQLLKYILRVNDTNVYTIATIFQVIGAIMFLPFFVYILLYK